MKFIEKYFESFLYFYRYLGYRTFVVLAFSLIIGILDGLGLTMFLPLLQLVNDSSSIDPESLGKLRFLVDGIIEMGIPLNLLTILLLMAFFFIIKGIMQYIAGIYRVNVQQWFIKSLRITNINLLNGIEYKYFVGTDVGRLQNTLTGEINRVANAFINYFTAVQYGILVFIYMVFAFTIDPQFAVLVSIGGVLTNFLYKSLYKNTKAVSRTLTNDSSIFQSLVIQNVANYKYLKATGSLNKYGEKLIDSTIKIEESNKKIGKLDALLNAGREPILIIVVVLVIYIQTAYFNADLGPILISLIFFYRALGYLMQLQIRWNKFLSFSGSLENMSLMEEELKENKETIISEVPLGSFEGLILKDLNFKYNDTQVLKDINLEICKKDIIAFVGESGSGKTTLVNIISGLLSVEDGVYLINNKDINQISRKSLQQKIGYITQDPVIFNDTIFNNISFWEEPTPHNIKRFWQVLKQASLFDFVTDLSEKENTLLGHNGFNLSGGQRQRISIARELYKNIEILILDEATSALDSETEKEIQENIENLKGKFTMLIVAHRISTIKNADRIVVMKNGKIENMDDFQNLISTSPYFKKIVELQEI